MNVSLVVDASVWVSWLRPVDINHSPSLIWMDHYIAKDGFLTAPTFFLVEVAASISRQTGQVMRAREAINQLRAISKIQIVAMDSALVEAAIDVATHLQLRAGDAIYVALARQLNIPLVSWDKEQLQKASTIITTHTPDTYTSP
ncbi:MAG TPA: type II toxin-antitoxin system VapC family toxin [Ktedonobacteraceae bacterium]|nr:type II toxin-antitoxin system VapC family toxin [Ktedonobacteraceae bacterium]